MTCETIKINTDQMVETEEISIDTIELDLGMNKIIGEEILEAIQEHTKIFRRQNSRGEYRSNYRNENYSRERGRSRSRERSFSRNNNNNRRINRSISNSRSRSGSKASTNRDRIRCYQCREYDHFAKDFPTSIEEREKEQLQQMLNLDEEQTSLKMLATDIYDSLNKINSLENVKHGHLNL